MSFAKARIRMAEQSASEEKDITKCAAYGCPCRATVNLAGNGWACSYHAFAEVDKWQSITRGLRDHDWLIGLMSDVQRMDRNNENWRAYATQFWQGSDKHCIPHAKENCVPYINRMTFETLWRIGLRKQRPEPRIPQLVKPAGRFAREALKEAA